MKKILKYIGIGFVVLFAAIIIVGNIGKLYFSLKHKKHAQSLEEMIVELNKHMPLRLEGSDFYEMKEVSLVKNNIVWISTLDTSFFYPNRESFLPEAINGGILPEGNRTMVLDLDTLLSNELIEQSHKLGVMYYYLFAKSNKRDPFYEEIIKRNYSQTWRFLSPFSKRHFEYTMTCEEMKKTAEYCNNQPNDALQEFLSEYVKRQNRLLNMASNNADISMHIVDNGSSFIFYCRFDESYSLGDNKPIDNIRDNQDVIHEVLSKDFHSVPIFYDMNNICKKTKRGFIFRYIDWIPKDSIDFVIY